MPQQKTPRRHLILPDTQTKPGVPIAHMGWAGQYAAEKKPDVIIHMGDHYDLPSLSSYDVMENPGEYHQRDYAEDLRVGDAALLLFELHLRRSRAYRPRKVFLVGNHEERYLRLIRSQPKLKGAIRAPWELAASKGWEVYPFLEPVIVDGISYCHFYPRGPNGTVVNSRNGAPSAKAQVQREMMSCVAGHKQGLDVHNQPTSRGMMRGVIAGSFYDHEESYLTPQGTTYWRGILLLTEVENGTFNLVEVSLGYLRRKYGK